MLDRLLHRSTQTAQSGNTAAALAVVRALTQQHPDDVRPWQALSELAEDDNERQSALAHIAALQTPARQPAAGSARERVEAVRRDRAAQRPTYLWAYVTGGVVLLLLLFWVFTTRFTSTSTAEQEGAQATSAATTNMTTTGQTSDSGARSAGNPAATTTIPPMPSATPTATSVATPSPVPAPTVLAPGSLVEQSGWYATLLRPEHAQVFSESLGDIPANGRFALAVLAVGNTEPEPRRIPADLFHLIDNQGRLYRPIEGASTAYLATYGRGEHGDLALEDAIPAGGSMFSVPLIFDVARDATGLVLTVGQGYESGWEIPLSTDAEGNPLPTASPNAGP